MSRSRRLATQAFVALVVVGAGVVLLALAGVPDRCPPVGWDGATRVAVRASGPAEISAAGTTYRVGGRALLGYGLGTDTAPLVRLGPLPHPLEVTLDVAAPTRRDVGLAAFACVRLTRGRDVWTRRAVNSEIRSPQWSLPGDSWRVASAGGGPEWPAGEPIEMEAWLAIDGRPFVLVFEPFALGKGG